MKNDGGYKRTLFGGGAQYSLLPKCGDIVLSKQNKNIRMHSSRIRTVRCSVRLGGRGRGA